jgi:hypothetical protein
MEMSFKHTRPKEFYVKGQYIILVEENEDGTKEVYSTNSKFWFDFFGGKTTIIKNKKK